MRLNIVQQKENPKAEDKKALLRYMAILDPYPFYHDCDHDMRRKPKRPLENTTFHHLNQAVYYKGVMTRSAFTESSLEVREVGRELWISYSLCLNVYIRPIR
jgi:hypothetical protein